MMQFIRETWVYLLIPFLLLYGLIGVFLLVSRDSPTPFSYNIF